MKKIDEKMLDENVKTSINNKKKGIFFINSNFTDELLEYLFLDVQNALNDNNIKEITFYINSNGGEVTTLLPLYDLIKATEKNVKTVVLGKAFSAGAMLLLSGTKGKRYAYENSVILLHEVATNFGYNKNSQTQEDAKFMNDINLRLRAMVGVNSKMTSDQLDKYFNSNKDIYITAKQALRFGIIDKIV